MHYYQGNPPKLPYICVWSPGSRVQFLGVSWNLNSKNPVFWTIFLIFFFFKRDSKGDVREFLGADFGRYWVLILSGFWEITRFPFCKVRPINLFPKTCNKLQTRAGKKIRERFVCRWGCLKIIRHMDQNIKLEITKKVCKVRLINVWSQTSRTNSNTVLGKCSQLFCLQMPTTFRCYCGAVLTT